MENKDKKLFLLDAYALIYRAYYAFINNPRINAQGLNTSAAFGFTNTLQEVLRKEKPSHIAVVFDTKAPTFRHKMYEAYKAQRPPMPEDLRKMIPYIRQIIQAYRIPILELDGYEADDLVGTLAKQAENQGFTVFMMTPDKDYCQLVSENIFMYKPRRSGRDVEIWGVPEVLEKFSIENPLQVIDILGLWGDASDNIPGAPGVGEVTSKKLIKQFGSIENLLKNTHKLKGKQQERIRENREQIELSKKLVVIDLNVPVEFDEAQLAVNEIDKQALKAVFEELGFQNLIKRIIKPEAPKGNAPSGIMNLFGEEAAETVSRLEDIKSSEHRYFYTETNEKQAELIKKLAAQSEFCFDTETTGLDTHTAELVGMSFAFAEREAYYVPVPAEREKANELLKKFTQVFENEQIKKIGQNLKYDIQMLQAYGIQVAGQLFDTMIAHYLLHPEQRHGLDRLAEKYLNYQPISIEKLIGAKKLGNMRKVSLQLITDYACEDADLTFRLKQIFEPKLREQNIENLFYEVETPLIYVLAKVERNGVMLETESLKKQSKQLVNELISIEKRIYELAGGFHFNIGSPKQLGEVLFDRMKIVENAKKTKTKQYSTSEQVLSKLIDKHEIISQILEYRSLKKLLSTYLESLPKLINRKTGRVHTSFNQAVVATGRLSSNNPNLQNIPIRTARGREIRRAFVASSSEHTLISADYSQVELRLMAHLSEDPNLIEAFMQGADIHTATASKIFKLPSEKVDREMRSQAKSANFGIIYGISAFGLAQNLKIPRKEAAELIAGYFESYPQVKEYMEAIKVSARKNGYVETIFGRRRYLKDINSRNAMVRGLAERNAINAPIQGSAADLIKLAMIEIDKQFQQLNLKSEMILQVHDELVFNVLRHELEQVTEIVRQTMEAVYQLKVPLKVDLGVGDNWLEAH